MGGLQFREAGPAAAQFAERGFNGNLDSSECGPRAQLFQGVAVSEAADVDFKSLFGEQAGALFRRRRRNAGFVNRELIVKQRGDSFDTFGGAVPGERGGFSNTVEQPVGLNRSGGEADEGQAAIFAFFDVNGDDKLVAAIGQARGTAC